MSVTRVFKALVITVAIVAGVFALGYAMWALLDYMVVILGMRATIILATVGPLVVGCFIAVYALIGKRASLGSRIAPPDTAG